MSSIINQVNSIQTAKDVFARFNPISEYVAIYVPSTVDVDTPIKNDSFAEVVMKTLSTMCGGCTAYNTIGSWVDDSGKLVTEEVTVCKAYCDVVTGDIAENTIKLASWLKRAMTQACISVEYNGNLMFV